jgi:hypothetical protein
MPDLITQFLKTHGPTLSSRIVEWLVKHGLTRETARQRVSRAGGPVKRLVGIQFPNRERFLFLQDDFGKPEFRDNLADALQQSRTSYGRALVALESRGGAVPEHFFPIISGLPVENAKGQVLASLVLDRLLKVGVLVRTPTVDGDVISRWDSDPSGKRRRATLTVEDVTLAVMKKWMGKINWTSPDATKIRSRRAVPKFGQFRWDLVGPSYLNSIVHFKNQKPVNGFVVADILLDKKITTADLEAFFAKWAVLTNQKRTARFQPVFIGDAFESDALQQLRGKGAIVARPETVFGPEVARHLRELIGTIENAAAAVTNNPEAVFQLLSQLSKIEGAASNLRGVVLELIIGRLFQLRGYNIDIRQQVRSESGGQAEIDVKAVNRQEVICIECKGKSPGVLVGKTEIEDWLETSVPRIKSWMKSIPSLPEPKRFEFYSSTDYTPEAKQLVASTEESHKKQPIKFYAAPRIISDLREQKEGALIEIFKEQFGSK